MTPDKRRPATPASQGPTRTAPDVPIVADRPSAQTKDGTQLLGPEGEAIAQGTRRGHAREDSARPRQTGHMDAERGARTPSPRRPLSLYPLPVWPD